MTEMVLDECFKKGLYTPVCSFDGQWSALVVKDRNNNPLTVLQLQKDVFTKVKSKILSKIFNSNCVDAGSLNSIRDINRKLDIEICEPRNSVYVKSVSSSCFRMSKHLVGILKERTKNSTETQCGDIDNTSIVSSLPSDVVSVIGDNLLAEVSKINEVPMIQSQTEMSLTGLSKLFHDLDDELKENTTESTSNDINMETADETVVDESDVKRMLEKLKNYNRSNKNGKWNIEVSEFLKMIESADKINKNFLAHDLQVCLKPVVGKLKSNGININISNPKWMHVNIISQVLGDKSEIKSNRRKFYQKSACALKHLCKGIIQKYTKHQLNIIMAENIFPDELDRWYNHSPYGKELNIDGLDCKGLKTWYCYPEFNQPLGSYVFMILDAYHQLCGLRRLLCANGIPAKGISKPSIAKVAEESESNGSGLNSALVTDLIDKQSIAYAVKTFSENVESALRKNDADKEATFCSLVRNWYHSEDEPGIPAIIRCKYRLELREWLLNEVKFGHFPPKRSIRK